MSDQPVVSPDSENVQVEVPAEVPAEKVEETPSPEAPAEATPSEVPSQPATPAVVPEEEDVEDLEEAVAEIKISAAPKVKDTRDHLNVVFIGHVDAGKSTIAGNIMLLTGMVDQRTMEKYDKEAKDLKRDSWYLAFIMDTNEEERAKGKTVEVGRAYFSTETRRFTVLDAPGHKNYVPNMIGGASQADIGILVISARKGEFETGFDRGGQTREHAMLSKTLGVNQLIVVINKMDEKTVEWSKARFDEIQGKLTPYLRSIGFNTQRQVMWIPISGYTGENIKAKVNPSVCTWYTGPTLLEALETIPKPKRSATGPLRIPVLDKYKESGRVIIQGKVEAGTVKLGQNVVVMPNKDYGKVVFLGTDLDERDECGPGENIRIVISGIKSENVSTGHMICDDAQPVRPVKKFEAQLYISSLLKHKPIFSAGYEAVMHAHTSTEECNILRLVSSLDPKTGKPTKQKPQFVQKGGTVICHITTTQPICVETYKDFPQLGRFTIRDEGKTIAIGKITQLPKASASVSTGASEPSTRA
eukprot:TRINITY_DN12369_c0_g1_i2.p1 TRINITY_DN12369_c0_g1~~TRINITY_DN12369_c0_g1_i2.p1  ORF type:complete len:544 (-),score=167.24 TRINITY_DN12369_c0_g1_i2:170-1756(-)